MTPTDSIKRPAPTSEAAGSAGNERENALAPFLAQLAAAHTGDLAISSSISLGDQSLALEPWEQEVLRKYADGVDSDGHPWPSLVLEGLAFAAKWQLRAQEEAGESPPDELILETAAGVAIFKELQSTIDQFLRGGRMREVKWLSDLRNRVSQGVTGMKSLIDGEALAAVEAKAAEMLADRAVSAPAAASAEGETAGEERKRPPTQFKKDPRPVHVVHRRPAKQSRLIRPLLVILIISTTIWVGLTVTRTRYVGPPELTIDEFRHIPSVRAVDARPPSLFVTLGEPAWSDMASEDRNNAVRQIGTVAEQAGYVGVQLWTADGAAAGRWSKKQGAELIRDLPEGS